MAVWFTATIISVIATSSRCADGPSPTCSKMGRRLDRNVGNAVVGRLDEVWHLPATSPFAADPTMPPRSSGRLRGRAIHLVRGNHDRKATLALLGPRSNTTPNSFSNVDH